MSNYDAIVVGAGLVGASAALVLSRAGWKVAVIEKNKFVQKPGGQSGKALALTYYNIDMLSKLGLDLEFDYEPRKIKSIHVSANKSVFHTSIAAKTYDKPYLGYIVDSNQLLYALQTKLQKEENISLYHSQNFDYSYNNLWCAKSKNNIFYSKLLIAADGVNSDIRRYVGINKFNFDIKESSLVANVKMNPYYQSNNFAYQRFVNDGILALLPLEKAMMKFVITSSDERISNIKVQSHEFILNYINDFFYPRMKFNQVSDIYTYPANNSTTNVSVTNNIVLLGNAKNSMSPIGAQGLNLSLIDINLLSKNLINNQTKEGLNKYAELSRKAHSLSRNFVDKIHMFKDKNHTIQSFILAGANLPLVDDFEILLGKTNID